MAAEQRAGRGRVVVLRRPARDLARRAHVHRLDLDDRQRLGRPLSRRTGRLTKQLIYRGPRASTTTTTRRSCSGPTATWWCSSAALRALPAAAGPARAGCATGSPSPVLDRRLRAGPHRPDQRARRPRLHLPEPDPAARQAVAVLARRRLEPDVLLHAQRPRLGARRASWSRFGARAAALREVRRRRQPPDPRHLHRGPRQPLQEQPHYLRYENAATVRGERATDRVAALRAAAHLQARPHLQYSRAAGAPGRTTSRSTSEGRPRIVYTRRVGRPRHVLLRVPQRRAVDQPPDRRTPARASRPSPPAARRSTTRTRASSTCRGRIGPSTRSSRGSRPTTAAPGRSRQLTSDPTGYCIRPVTPRGLAAPTAMLYVRGDERTKGSPTSGRKSTRCPAPRHPSSPGASAAPRRAPRRRRRRRGR